MRTSILFVGAALVALSACAGGSGTTTLAATEVALTAAENSATTYTRQPACPTPGTLSLACSDAATIAKIKAADNVAYTSVQQAKTGSVTAASAAAAVAALSALIPK